MIPEIRWLVAGAVAVAIVFAALERDHRPDRSLSHIGSFFAQRIDPPPPTPDTVDLESRWIGHGVIVKHHPDEAPTCWFAHRDADGRWTNSADEGDSSTRQPTDP